MLSSGRAVSLRDRVARGQTGASFNRAHYTGAYCAMLATGWRTTPEALGKQVPPMGLDPPNLDQQSVAPRRARSWLVVFRALDTAEPS